MKKVIIALIIVFVLAGGGVAFELLRKPSAKKIVAIKDVKNAEPFPDITFTNLKGNSFQVQTLPEPVVLVHFWATWCAPCLVEFPALIDFIREMDGKVALVAVSLDYTAEPLERFIARQDVEGLPVHWVRDQDFSLAYKQFLISQAPETIIVGPGRLMRDKIVGQHDWAGEDIRKQLTKLAQGSI